MKNTILSEKDSILMEKALMKYGRILHSENLVRIFKTEYSLASAHNRINLLVKVGWLRRIKRGLFLIIDTVSARSKIDISLHRLANALMEESYVSLAHALNYYQLFDQLTNTIVSITDQRNKRYIFDEYTFVFSKVKADMYFGFTEKIDNGKIVRIADAEKALLDYLYLDTSFGSASLVFEKLRDHGQSLDTQKLQKYALRANLTTQRKIGFMLDMLKINTALLYKEINKNVGVSYFTKNSKEFNAKWRLYYDPRIIG